LSAQCGVEAGAQVGEPSGGFVGEDQAQVPAAAGPPAIHRGGGDLGAGEQPPGCFPGREAHAAGVDEQRPAAVRAEARLLVSSCHACSVVRLSRATTRAPGSSWYSHPAAVGDKLPGPGDRARDGDRYGVTGQGAALLKPVGVGPAQPVENRPGQVGAQVTLNRARSAPNSPAKSPGGCAGGPVPLIRSPAAWPGAGRVAALRLAGLSVARDGQSRGPALCADLDRAADRERDDRGGVPEVDVGDHRQAASSGLDPTIWASRSRVIPVAFWNRPITRPRTPAKAGCCSRETRSRSKSHGLTCSSSSAKTTGPSSGGMNDVPCSRFRVHRLPPTMVPSASPS
jgi:hypothetical protein